MITMIQGNIIYRIHHRITRLLMWLFSLTCSSLCFHCCQPSAGILGSPAVGLRSSLAIPDRVTQGGGALDFWGIFLKARLRNWQKERCRLMQTLDMTIIATVRSDYRLLMAFCSSAPRSSGSVSLSVPRITTASFKRMIFITWVLFSAMNYWWDEICNKCVNNKTNWKHEHLRLFTASATSACRVDVGLTGLQSCIWWVLARVF